MALGTRRYYQATGLGCDVSRPRQCPRPPQGVFGPPVPAQVLPRISPVFLDGCRCLGPGMECSRVIFEGGGTARLGGRPRNRPRESLAVRRAAALLEAGLPVVQ